MNAATPTTTIIDWTIRGALALTWLQAAVKRGGIDSEPVLAESVGHPGCAIVELRYRIGAASVIVEARVDGRGLSDVNVWVRRPGGSRYLSDGTTETMVADAAAWVSA